MMVISLHVHDCVYAYGVRVRSGACAYHHNFAFYLCADEGVDLVHVHVLVADSLHIFHRVVIYGDIGLGVGHKEGELVGKRGCLHHLAAFKAEFEHIKTRRFARLAGAFYRQREGKLNGAVI